MILNAQQASMSRNPDAPEIDVNVDAPNIRIRRMLDDMIAAEQSELTGARRSA